MGGSAAFLLPCTALLSAAIPKLHCPSLAYHQTFFFDTETSLRSKGGRRRKPVSSGAFSSGANALPVPSLADLEGLDSDEFPALRTFENDLGRLSVIGDVSLQQALAAAAADGGRAADEHIAGGLPVMVVETVFPGHPGEHSTVSTRLFLPARKVKEKAKKLRSSLTADILSTSTSNTILAMTFRQVVIQRLWSFELALFQPGTERDMNELGNPREVPLYFTLSSSDEKVLSAIAEAVCTCGLENTKINFLCNKSGLSSRKTFNWSKKRQKITSMDSSVCLYQFSYNEVAENTKKLWNIYESNKGNSVLMGGKLRHAWWPSPACSRAEIDGSSEFATLVQEYVPAYKLQVDADKFKSLKFEGWQKCQDNRWEIILSHSQMVELADILDMYYEDSYTVPYKNLWYNVDSISSSNLKSKQNISIWQILSAAVATGIVVVIISVLGKLYFHGFWKFGKSIEPCVLSMQDMDSSERQSSGNTYPMLSSSIGLSPMELETLCVSVIERIKDNLGLSGNIEFNVDVGAWSGEIPPYLRTLNGIEFFPKGTAPNDGSNENISNATADLAYPFLPESRPSPDKVDQIKQAPLTQDVASYELLLSMDGKVLGLQPTSLVAVNHWATNPLARALYEGRKLSPGLFEPCLKIQRPDRAILLELLMSVGSASRFTLVRPLGMMRQSP